MRCFLQTKKVCTYTKLCAGYGCTQPFSSSKLKQNLTDAMTSTRGAVKPNGLQLQSRLRRE